MEKIFIACMVLLFIIYISFESFESFKRRSLYFLLKRNKLLVYKEIFVYESLSMNDYIKNRPGMMAQMVTSFVTSFFKKETKVLLQEIEGFDQDRDRLAKQGKYEEAARLVDSGSVKTAELYIALGSPQF